jgi:hypothetical protein
MRMPNLPLGGSAPPLGNVDDCRREMTTAGFDNVEVREVGHALPAMTIIAMATSARLRGIQYATWSRRAFRNSPLAS